MGNLNLLVLAVSSVLYQLVNGAPTLSVSPSSVVVGGSVTFTCTFTSAALFGAEIKITVGEFSCVLNAADTGSTCSSNSGPGCVGNTLACSSDKKTYSLTVNSVPETWNGKKFICKDTIINNDESQEVVISLLVKPTKITITPTENIVSIEERQTADLTCTTDATRPQSNITWYRDNAPITGATQSVTSANGDKFVTSSVLTLSGDRDQQGVQIHCTAINVQGGSPVSSRTKTINIQYPPKGKPTFATINHTMSVGTTVTLTCTLQEDGNPQANWTWSCPGRTIQPSEVTSRNGSSVLQFTSTKSDNGKSCTCRAQSNIGPYDQTSSSVTLNIQYPPVGKPTLATTNPTVTVGTNVTLTCTLQEDGNPLANWTWSCRGRIIQPSEVTSSNGRSVLQFTSNKADNGRSCTCRAQSNIGTYDQTSNTAVLNIQYPPTGTPTLTPTNPTMTVGTTVTLTCTVQQDGNPPANWTWSCPGRSIQTNEVTSSNGSSVLWFISTKADNGRNCACRAHSNIGSYDQTSNTAILNIHYSPMGTLTLTPTSATSVVGTTVTLTCTLQQDGNPLANWTWSCPGRSIQINEVTSSNGRSVLQFTSNKADNGRSCTCRAHSNIGPYDETSNSVTLNIQFAPSGSPAIVANPPGLAYNATVPVNLNCTWMGGNPVARLTWTCGGVSMSGGSYSATKESYSLTLVMNKTFNGKQCTCVGSHVVGNISKEKAVTLVVFYAAEITFFPPPSTEINENDHVLLNCSVDGNPSPLLQWQIADNGTTIKSDTSNSSVRLLEFFHIKCLDTATYRANVRNGYGNEATKDVNISVLCKPKFDDRENPENKISVGSDKKLSISLPIIGNPMPIVTWYRQVNSSNETFKDSNTISILTEKKGNVEYISKFNRSSMLPEDFGVYFAVLSNSIGKSVVVYSVDSERSPDPPSDIVVDCSQPESANIYWMSNFNGLDQSEKQEFYVLYRPKDVIESKFKRTEHILDKGNNMTRNLNLSPGKWVFKVESKNRIGSVISLEEGECEVRAHKSEKSPLLPAVLGSLGAVVVIIAVAVVLLLFRRIQSKKKDIKEDTKGWPLTEHTQECDDGIKDNILYVSAGPNVPSTSNGPTDVYAEVVKKPKTKKVDEKVSDVYAEVQKPAKKAKNVKKGKKDKKEKVEGDVYENVEPKINDEAVYTNKPTKEERGTRNQDGLLYVEVDLRPVPEERRNVIIGEEERTDYASVDFILPNPAAEK